MIKVKADLHSHIRTHSDMSRVKLTRLVDSARNSMGKGPKVLGICNFADDRAEQIAKRHQRVTWLKKLPNALYIPAVDVLLVKGEEIQTTDGHLVLLGVPLGVHPEHGRSVEDSVKEARERGWATIAAHPYHTQGIGKSLLTPVVEAKEILIEKRRDLEGLEHERRLRKISGHMSDEHLNELIRLAKVETEGIWRYMFNPRCDRTKKALPDAFEYTSEAALPLPPFSALNPNGRALKVYESIRKLFSGLGFVASSDGHSYNEIGTSYVKFDFEKPLSKYNGDEINKQLISSIRQSRPANCVMKSARAGAVVHTYKLAKSILDSKIERKGQRGPDPKEDRTNTRSSWWFDLFVEPYL